MPFLLGKVIVFDTLTTGFWLIGVRFQFTVGGPIQCGSYSAGVRYCAGEIAWHNIDTFIVADFYLVRVLGIVRVNVRDTYPHYIGPPTVLEKKNVSG